MLSTQSLSSLVINSYCSFSKARTVGYPFLQCSGRLRVRQKDSMKSLLRMFKQVDKHILTLSIRYHHSDTLICDASGNVTLARHAATSQRAFLVADIFIEISSRLHYFYNRSPWIIRITIIDAVNIAQNNKFVGIHHRSDKTGKFIVVGKHKFRYTYRVVFVYNRNHPILNHHLHTRPLVKIFAACGETLFHCKNLTYMNIILTEKVIIKIHQLHLSYSRE